MTEWDLDVRNWEDWNTGGGSSWCRGWKVFWFRLRANVWRVNENETECGWGECSGGRNCPPLGVGVNTERDLVSPRVEKVTSVGSGWLAI